jgi:hypothetical protein
MQNKEKRYYKFGNIALSLSNFYRFELFDKFVKLSSDDVLMFFRLKYAGSNMIKMHVEIILKLIYKLFNMEISKIRPSNLIYLCVNVLF